MKLKKRTTRHVDEGEPCLDRRSRNLLHSCRAAAACAHERRTAVQVRQKEFFGVLVRRVEAKKFVYLVIQLDILHLHVAQYSSRGVN